MPDNVSRDEVAVIGVCPFCGASGELIKRHNPMSKWKWSVDCSGSTCGASGPVEASQAAAIAAWNTRLAAIATQSASDDWRGIETAVRDCVTKVDLWCTSDDGEGWLIRGILMIGQPDWIKRDDQSDYFPHENGGWLTHWRPLPAPPNADPLSPGASSRPTREEVARVIDPVAFEVIDEGADPNNRYETDLQRHSRIMAGRALTKADRVIALFERSDESDETN